VIIRALHQFFEQYHITNSRKDKLLDTLVNTRLWRTALWMLCLIVGYLALSPSPPHGASLGWDKLNHAAAFAAMAFAAVLALRNLRWHRRYVALGLVGYGGAIEIAQWFVPGRSCEWGDLLADCIGIAVGAQLATVMLRVVLRLASRTHQH
jgi:VanZ family protein